MTRTPIRPPITPPATVELADGTVTLTYWHIADGEPDLYGRVYRQISGYLPDDYVAGSISTGTNRLVRADLPGRGVVLPDVNVEVNIGWDEQPYMGIRWLIPVVPLRQRTDPLAPIWRMESAAFRVGRVARQLVTEHPDLALRRLYPTASGADAELELETEGLSGVRAWAQRLGVEPRITVSSSGDYKFGRARATIDGVLVLITGGDLIDAEGGAAV
ncbi:hypothetical protein AB0A77_28545 [Streptomyces varsoviensis]|uniref:hypothetical protein n=1 Tax=Streptomyces varsoviensis TaxID=67373 RepID=UPI0033E7EE9B